MHQATHCRAARLVRSSNLQHWTLIAGVVAICASCSSDEDNTTSPKPGTAGTAGMAGGGRAAAGATGLPAAGAGGTITAGGAGGVAGELVGGATNVAGSGQGGSEVVAGAGGVAAGGTSVGTAGTAGGFAAPIAVYVGCADSSGSIMHFALNRTTGELTPVGIYSTGVSNSWATINAAQNRMYVNSRTVGRITTLSRDTATGALSVLASVAVPMAPTGTAGAPGAAGASSTAGAPSVAGAGGAGTGAAGADVGAAGSTNVASAGAAGATGTTTPPVTNPSTQVVTLDGSEHYLLAANYSANYVYVYALAADGTVGSMVASQVDGVSSHQAVFAPGSNNGLVLVPYRGSDTIATYQFNATTGALTLAQTFQSDDDAALATTGPRHLVFHPAHNDWAYVVNEVAGSISMLNFNVATGALTQQQSVSSVPADYAGPDKFASEIAVAPTGNFVYVSNRYSTAAAYTAEGSVGVFAVNATNGQLTPVEFQGSRGALPRHFELSKDGSVLIVGNQNSNNVAVFAVDQTTGKLTLQKAQEVCPTPFFVKLVGG